MTDDAKPWRILEGDCAVTLADLPAESVDACVTDTPYGLSTLLDPPNLDREALWRKLTEGAAESPIRTLMRAWLDTGDNPKVKGRGFMGKEWDALVPSPNTWRAVWRVLKPGAYCFAFGGTRTADLISMSLRLADFEVDDTLSWLYGQGFPKRVRLDLKIDQHFGKAAERPVIGSRLGMPGMAKDGSNQRNGFDDAFGGAATGRMSSDITGAATPEAARFVGWDRALRPGWEPIIVAVKPLRGTVAENALRYGTGGLHVDACRLPRGDGLGAGVQVEPGGGYPANVAMDGSELSLLRLKSSLPAETEKVIRRYFCGSSMPHMRGRVFEGTESHRSGEGTVLLTGVLREAPVGDSEGRDAPDARQTSHPRSHRGNEGGGPTQHEGGTGEPAVQGLHDVTRVQDADDIGFGREGEGTRGGNVDATGEGVRASFGDGSAPGKTAAAHGDRPSRQRREDGQQDRKSGDARRRDAQTRAPGHHQGTATITAGQRRLEVTADVVPLGWFEYFEDTGRSVIDPDSPAALLDTMSGQMRDGVAVKHNTEVGKVTGRFTYRFANTGEDRTFGGGGGASRFFYVAKASSSERDAGLADLPPLTAGERCDREDGTAGVNGYAGTRGEGGRCIHPTVKPIALMRWLCRLAAPPGAHDPDMSKRPVILDPFFGSGSTGVAALAEGLRVIGCEMMPEYVEIARRRCQHAYALPPDDPERAEQRMDTRGQKSLF